MRSRRPRRGTGLVDVGDAPARASSSPRFGAAIAELEVLASLVDATGAAIAELEANARGLLSPCPLVVPRPA